MMKGTRNCLQMRRESSLRASFGRPSPVAMKLFRTLGGYLQLLEKTNFAGRTRGAALDLECQRVLAVPPLQAMDHPHR